MASFDVTKSASKAYLLIWAERRYLLRLAIVPVIVKLICFTIIMKLGWDQEYIKHALVMLPAYLTEGWLLAHLVRLIFFGQRWPFRPTGNLQNDERILRQRAQGIIGGSVFYALIQFLQNGAFAFIQSSVPPSGGEIIASSEPTLEMFLLSVLMLVGLIWAFRLFWLFIPAAANYPVRAFLAVSKGFSVCLGLIAVWMICLFPLVFILFATISQVLGSLDADILSVPTHIDFMLSLFKIVMGTAIAISATAGISYAIKEMLPDISKAD